jgi:4-amino-4-deoxy-L-arabinose transferase-like glycosyltransferase
VTVTTVLEREPDLPTIAVEPPHPPRASVLRRLWRGPDYDPAWARPALFGLLGATAVLYLWGLGASGWANSYYAMAVQAGTKSWKAFFFGSLDAGNSITVDKSPASLWVMDLSARMFGVNSWAILVPQALEGVATVGLVYAAIKRWFGPPAALLAGAVCALTPVAALMFRFNNPDALLVLLLVAGAYALTRALEKGSTWCLVAAFSFVGFGFLAKELQALVVLPPFAGVYLLAGPPKLGRRIGQLAVATGAFLVSALWWVMIVQLWPASSRPYIGGSQNNSLWNVIFGYNGLGRLSGNERGSVVGGGGQGQAGQWGPTGIFRMFNQQFGGQASWLIPAAVIMLVAGLAFTLRMPRTDRTRAALLLWGGWLVFTAGAFSLGQGIIHPYYTVALAPAIGALVGVGATRLWSGRQHPAARAALVVAFAATAWWAYVLLGRTPNWHPALRTAVLLGGVVVTGLLIACTSNALRRGAAAIAAAALVIALAAPAAYTLATVAQPHEGAIPSAGPAEAAQLGNFGPGGRGGFGNRGQFRIPNGGQFPGFGTNNGGGRQFPGFGNINGGQVPSFGNGGVPGAQGQGGPGGLLNGSTSSAAMTTLLKNGASGYRWAAAAIGANEASGYQLASGAPVMSIGGFNGTDPSPTLAQFQSYVAQHKIHYYIAGRGFGGFGGRGGGFGNSSTTSEISQWVQDNFTSQTVGGVTVYDLTRAA